MKRTVLLVVIVATLLLPFGWFIHVASYARHNPTANAQALTVSGTWSAHNYDLVYTVAFSSERQPNGPLVAYRASGSDLRSNVAVIAVVRGPLPQTPLFFPSPNGQYLALLTPGYLNSANLRILSSEGQANTLLVPGGVAAGDQVVWSADSQALYYHSGTEGGYDEIHRVDLYRHDIILLHRQQDESSLRLVGVDRTGSLILTWARPQQPVALLRLDGNNARVIATLPSDILPGNVLRIGSDGASVECERVLNWEPLRYTVVRISFANSSVTGIAPLFATFHFGSQLTALNRSGDGRVLVMSQVMSVRHDLAVQGIADVPAQEALLVADPTSGATEKLTLPPGGQVVQTFWTRHVPLAEVRTISQNAMAASLVVGQHMIGGGAGGENASVFQQDEWMLEGHAGILADGPSLPAMCYGYCSHGKGKPHVSAAILHGVAYVETNWHQFNSDDYRVNGELVGSPVESWDGGWGEFQQTWGMPPQCASYNNCRSDASRIQYEQAYNIGTGVQSLISAWNGSAEITSSTDPNDPYKANHWFFAVWAYNGSYGNNPNDVSSSVYKHWYPGAPFRSIYEEYVWYFAAHPQYWSNGWTDDYLPSLGSSLLPPQSDFVNTSDSFVACFHCSIPDWTAGSYDTDWVGMGAPNVTIAASFKALFGHFGGEDVVGLPRDNQGGAAVHRWGSGWVQDFGGGSYQPGAFMLLDGTTTPYWVYGGVWASYSTADHGATGCHGYPTSGLQASSGPGSDSYFRQNFQRGYIVWDATTHTVSADVCD